MFDQYVEEAHDNIAQLLRRIHYITHLTKVWVTNTEPVVIDEADLRTFLSGLGKKKSSENDVVEQKSDVLEVAVQPVLYSKSGGNNLVKTSVSEEAPLTYCPPEEDIPLRSTAAKRETIVGARRRTVIAPKRERNFVTDSF